MTLSRRSFCAALVGGAAASAATRPAAALGFWQEADDPYRVSAIGGQALPARYRKQFVRFDYPAWPGTIVIDSRNRYLYLVMERGMALRYGVGVGRDGFRWSGKAEVGRKLRWPDWTPPAEMMTRDPKAAKWASGMPGGPANPLGARALYLYQGKRDTMFRIHGTNNPASIGKAMSSGCIRMLNEHVIDLYRRTPLGTRVVVL